MRRPYGNTSAEYRAFKKLVGRILAMPAETIKERVEEHRREAAQNPNRRSPKPKVKPSASGRASRAKG